MHKTQNKKPQDKKKTNKHKKTQHTHKKHKAKQLKTKTNKKHEKKDWLLCRNCEWRLSLEPCCYNGRCYSAAGQWFLTLVQH